jgi:hypothetical protein
MFCHVKFLYFYRYIPGIVLPHPILTAYAYTPSFPPLPLLPDRAKSELCLYASLLGTQWKVVFDKYGHFGGTVRSVTELAKPF